MPQASSPLSDWLAWLESLSPNEIELGLDRVQAVLERMALRRPPNVLLIAGTNGKGSSVAMLSALLDAAGMRCGAYTSPHVHLYNERIVVDGVPAGDAEIIAALARVESARKGVPLTYFEFGTLAAADVFASRQLDVWILEIGMGGRLDACNAFEPTASLITNVSLDHCGWLGEDIESIAVEKAGVMRPSVPTIYAAPEAPRAILDQAKAHGSELLLLGRDYDFVSDSGNRWRFAGLGQNLADLAAPGLRGDFQLQNAAGVLALMIAADLGGGLTTASVNAVLPTVSLTGRMQAFERDSLSWLFDVAHNPAAAAALAATLDGAAEGATWAMIGLLDDKDLEGIVEPLDDRVDHWVAVAADNPRSLAAEECARRIANRTGRPCLIGESLADALRYIEHRAAPGDRIVVTGSFYLVGPALQALGLYSRPES